MTAEIIKESMRDSKNFKAHLKMCKDSMGSTLQYDLELLNIQLNSLKAQTQVNAQDFK